MSSSSGPVNILYLYFHHYLCYYFPHLTVILKSIDYLGSVSSIANKMTTPWREVGGDKKKNILIPYRASHLSYIKIPEMA